MMKLFDDAIFRTAIYVAGSFLFFACSAFGQSEAYSWQMSEWQFGKVRVTVATNELKPEDMACKMELQKIFDGKLQDKPDRSPNVLQENDIDAICKTIERHFPSPFVKEWHQKALRISQGALLDRESENRNNDMGVEQSKAYYDIQKPDGLWPDSYTEGSVLLPRVATVTDKETEFLFLYCATSLAGIVLERNVHTKIPSLERMSAQWQPSFNSSGMVVTMRTTDSHLVLLGDSPSIITYEVIPKDSPRRSIAIGFSRFNMPSLRTKDVYNE